MTIREHPPIVDKASDRGVASLIGRTPLVRLRRFETKLGLRLFAKLEMFNPGGSVKDRPALYMIREGERTGKLNKKKTILDATSGNTGIAYSMLGAALGYRVKMIVPANASKVKVMKMKSFGADVVLTKALEGIDAAIRNARHLSESEPETYFYPDQYNNPANPLSHYETTAPEIIQQTDSKITHLVAGVGTSGTLVGTARRLKEFNERIRVVEVQPDGPLHGIEGLKHLESSLLPSIYDEGAADVHLRVSTEEAQEMARAVAAKERIIVGTSSGAAMAGALKLYSELKEGNIVVIFPDSSIEGLHGEG